MGWSDVARDEWRSLNVRTIEGKREKVKFLLCVWIWKVNVRITRVVVVLFEKETEAEAEVSD